MFKDIKDKLDNTFKEKESINSDLEDLKNQTTSRNLKKKNKKIPWVG